MFTKKAISSSLKSYLRPLIKPRHFHAYCVGTPKSGTHSIAGLFSTNYRACHEPELKYLRNILLLLKDGLMSQEELLSYVRARDKRLWLELDSSALNVFLIDILVKEFERAKFILTIRDCYSWMASAINHRVTRKRPPNWQRLQELSYGTCTFEYAKEEDILKQYQLPTVDAYLAYWTEHNQKVLKQVPQDRLLVIRTQEISQKVETIADFIGVSVGNLECRQSHLFQTPKKHFTLSQIDLDFIKEKSNIHCSDLMAKFFPDFDSEVMIQKLSSQGLING